MALTYATITGQILDPVGDPLERVPVYIEAAAANGVIKDTVGKVVFRGRKKILPDSAGNYEITLPELPQADIDPGDAKWRLVFSTAVKVFGASGWKTQIPESVEFELTANSTWADLIDVSSADPTAGLVAQMTDLRDETIAAAGAVAYTQTRMDLRKWYEHLAKRAARRVNVTLLGDSIFEGALVGTPTYTKRSLDLFQKQLRARMGLAAGGVGYMPAYYAGALINDDTTRAGATPTEKDFEWGPGGKCLELVGHASTPGELTWPAITCDRVRIYYGRSNSVSGNFKVFIDASDVTSSGTLGGNGTSGASGATVTNVDGSAKSGGYYWESAALSLASHTVMVRANVAGFGSQITAAEFFSGDLASGVHVIDAAHTGAQTSQYLPSTMNPAWQEHTTHAADLTVVNLGTNEAIAAVSATSYQADLTSLVGKIKTSSASGQILIVHGWRPSTVSQSVWDAYGAARRAVVDAEPLAAYLDLEDLWMPLTTNGAENNGLMYESTNPIHPNDAGHQRLADILTSVLLPT